MTKNRAQTIPTPLGVIATLRGDGSPPILPAWFRWDTSVYIRPLWQGDCLDVCRRRGRVTVGSGRAWLAVSGRARARLRLGARFCDACACIRHRGIALLWLDLAATGRCQPSRTAG